MRIESFAKINLGLEVLGKRPDGCHEIRTFFQTVDFADRLEFRSRPRGGIGLSGDDPGIPWDERNLIHRAAALLRERAGAAAGVDIRVEKRIPAGKGLGGGSGNAAVTLWALDRLWGLGLGPAELAAAAASLGADVPYFLHGGLCLGTGRGDLIEPLPDLPTHYCVLALPPEVVPTAGVYAALGAPALTSATRPGKMIRFPEPGDFGLLRNQLEETIFRAHPGLESLKTFFRDRGAAPAMVSGSGSAVYGLFAEREAAEAAREALRSPAVSVLAPTLSREGYWTRLRAGV